MGGLLIDFLIFIISIEELGFSMVGNLNPFQ